MNTSDPPPRDASCILLSTFRFLYAAHMHQATVTLKAEDILDATLDCLLRLYIEQKLDAGRSEGEIHSFIKISIKNALVDHQRQMRRGLKRVEWDDRMEPWHQSFIPEHLDLQEKPGLENKKVEATLKKMVDYLRENDLPVAEKWVRRRTKEVNLPYGITKWTATNLDVSRDTVERNVKWLRRRFFFLRRGRKEGRLNPASEKKFARPLKKCGISYPKKRIYIGECKKKRRRSRDGSNEGAIRDCGAGHRLQLKYGTQSEEAKRVAVAVPAIAVFALALFRSHCEGKVA